METNGASAERKGIDKDLSMLSHDRAREGASSGLGRGLIYEWDQTLEEVDHADWPSPTPL